MASVNARPDERQHLGDGAPGLAELARLYPPKRGRGEGCTLDEVRGAVARPYALMPLGRRLTTDRYRALDREHQLPCCKAVGDCLKRDGVKFTDVVREAAAERADAARASRQ